MLRKIWTAQEDDIMREKYPHIQTNDLCKLLNRPYSSVSNRAYFLHLKKSEAFLKSDLSGRLTKLSESGKVYRYPKGHTPANKGKKMPDDVYEKVKHTMFKKGQSPKNTYDRDGVITIRHDHPDSNNTKPYKWIRISLGKWKLLHQHIWEQANGPVPKNHCLWFKDGNSLNCVIENLELITRADNARRNHDKYLSYPEELKSTIKVISKLNKKIKEHEKQS